MPHEGGRLDAHQLGELPLARTLGVVGFAQQHPRPHARVVRPQARVELVVDGAVREKEVAAQGGGRHVDRHH